MTVVIEGRALTQDYRIPGGLFGKASTLRAVNEVNFTVERGRTLAIVGESGSGKSTLARIIALIDTQSGGQLLIEGEEINLGRRRPSPELRSKVQMVFQNPYGSLNPRQKVGDVLMEPLVINTKVPATERRERAEAMLQKVGLAPEHFNRYPHMFSGGQRQRIAIARALALRPAFIVADEPVSALDVSVQAQVLHLLKELQTELNLTYLFVAHNLAVVEYISDRVAVMYVGKIVELGQTEEIFANPKHPYTEALLSAVPTISEDTTKKQRIVLEGDVADSMNVPTGCYFHPRCKYAEDICRTETPPFVNVAAQGASPHYSLCHFAESLSLEGVTMSPVTTVNVT